jgi:hypothetical protein
MLAKSHACKIKTPKFYSRNPEFESNITDQLTDQGTGGLLDPRTSLDIMEKRKEVCRKLTQNNK